MFAALLPALVTCGVALFIASLVLARRERAPIHWVYLALLLAIAGWTGGAAWRFTHVDEAGVRFGLHWIYLGMLAAPPLWFWLTLLYTRSSLAESHWLRFVSFLLPAIGYLGWWTNDAHHLWAVEVSHDALMAGPRAWAGPMFWMSLSWIFGFAGAGAWLVLRHAWRLRGTREQARAIELSLALLAPFALSQVYVFGLLPIPYDLTPTGLLVTVVVFYGLVAREGIFETLPLARRDVIEHLRDGVLLADSGGTLLDANPAGLGLLERTRRRAIGRPLASLVAGAAVGASARDVSTALERAARGEGPALLRFDTVRGRCIDLSAAPVLASRGQPAGFYAVLRDCTELVRHERLLRQSQKLESVGVLAAGLAHEVNNPLAFMQANLGLLQEMAESVERNLHRLPEKDARALADLREVLDDSLEGISRISGIVNRLRRFSRAPDESARGADPNAAAEEAIRFAQLDRQGGWCIESRLASDLPAVRGNGDALTQVLLNLLLNAVQAVGGREDGRVVVETSPCDEGVRIRVRDNGPGVPDTIRDHIFDPFFTTKPPDQGTGLGLAIAYDITREHGGRLFLAEDADSSEGACFCLTLPPADAGLEPALDGAPA